MKRESLTSAFMKRQSRNVAIAALIVFVLILAVAILYTNSIQQPNVKPGSLNSTFNVSTLHVEYAPAHKPAYTINYSAYFATTFAQQELGYMNQTSLGNCDGRQNCIGMLFVFQNDSTLCFWMKNTEIPLKQVWISSDGHVNLIYNGTPYSTSTICGIGQYVLETSINSTINASDVILPG